jgi:hypothetical protein
MIVRAPQKDNWRILPHPLTLETAINNLFVGIPATRVLPTEQQDIIVIDVKCFADIGTTMQDLYTAIGQYLVYRETSLFLEGFIWLSPQAPSMVSLNQSA